MFFRKEKRQQENETISPVIAQAIEDAILLGNVREIDDVLALIGDDEEFPKELRYGLEALRHFRAHYGTGKELEPAEPLQKRKAAIMEIAWGAELLDMLKNEGKIIGLQTRMT